jgi:hypothetical protein
MANPEDQPTATIQKEDTVAKPKSPTCGIVMPISPIDGMSSEHWLDVLGIIKEVTVDEGFDTNLVSAAEESGIIQQRIIQNLYKNDIVICDVSGKNPNVMFELGMRLAFDKATIVIKDDETDYSFDTSPLEHIEYPRDLRFTKIIAFKSTLATKLKATFEKSKDKEYSTFLKHFGTFNVQALKEKDGGMNDYLLTAIQQLTTEVLSLKRGNSFTPPKLAYTAKIIGKISFNQSVFTLVNDFLVGVGTESQHIFQNPSEYDYLIRYVTHNLKGQGIEFTESQLKNAVNAALESL